MRRVKSIKYALFAFALGFLASGLAPRPALAATASASFAVTVTVQAACQVSAPATAFGTYATAGARATSAISVACTIPTPYNVSRSAGLAASDTRRVTASAPVLTSDASLTNFARSIYRGRMAGTNPMAGSGNGASQPYTVSGLTAGARFVAPGAYADTITVTVSY
jgi:spore coat protein U-like protein